VVKKNIRRLRHCSYCTALVDGEDTYVVVEGHGTYCIICFFILFEQYDLGFA